MTLDLAKLRADTLALIDGTTPGPLEKVTQAGDWGLPGAHLVQPSGCKTPYGIGAAVAVIEYETPYPLGASRKDRDNAKTSDANARLIAADTIRLLDEIERLTGGNAKLAEALHELAAACEAYPVNIARADAALGNAHAVLRAFMASWRTDP